METLKVIRTLPELNELIDYLADKEYIAFDTETDGVEKTNEIIGFSVCADVEVGYYVILSYWDVPTQKMVYLETKEGAKHFLSLLTKKKLVMQNMVFDCMMVYNNFGIDLREAVHTDTMILAHLVNENRKVGLKELGVALFGEDARQEQIEMRKSVYANGGVLTKDLYELYKADCELIARYGAKDAILTLKLFYVLVPELIEQGLDGFFYDDESMPLLRGPTYELNTTGLRVDPMRLQALKQTLEAECLEAKAFVDHEVAAYVKDKYKGTSKANTFNIASTTQLAWLLFVKLDNVFNNLTKEGRKVCKFLGQRLPYTKKNKYQFIEACINAKGEIYSQPYYDRKTKKEVKAKKVRDVWNYLAAGKETLTVLAPKYKWLAKFLEFKKNLKLLNTYVLGIERGAKYNVIRPNFLQHGTTSGRYSCKRPNFQNLPRDDKRVKSCIVARPGMVFVGADYAQLEPRVFASFSGDERLLACFENGDDFYSVIGMEVFDKYDCSLKKDDPNSFAKKYPQLRNIAKVVALSATYGTTAPKMALAIDKTIQEAQEVIDSYFEKFPKVKEFMLAAHEEAKRTGMVKNLFGRPRRMPQAMEIEKICPGASHAELPYELRNTLNLAVNHKIQSTGASIMNRAAILLANTKKELGWNDVKIVLQVHDELVIEGPEALKDDMALLLKHCMERAVILPNVNLLAEPKIGYNLAELK